MNKKVGIVFGDVFSQDSVTGLDITGIYDVYYDNSKGGYVVCEPGKAEYKMIMSEQGEFCIRKDCELLIDLI